LVLPHVLLRATKALGETAVIELSGSGHPCLPSGQSRRRRSRLHNRCALPNNSQLGVNQPLVLQSYALQIGPKALLDLPSTALERDLKIRMLRRRQLAEIAFH